MRRDRCSCGDPNPHEIARRPTADGKAVVAYSDGTLTEGSILRLIIAERLPRRVLELVLDQVGLYDAREVRQLAREARKAFGVVSVRPVEYVARRMAGEKLQALKGGAVVRWLPRPASS